MNDVMSFGAHRLWKKQFIDQIPLNSSTILDVASGTGDIAIGCYKKLSYNNSNIHIVTCDINQDMLSLAQDKAVDANILAGLDYAQCNAEKLPFADNSFDCYTITFGIRNVTNVEAALKESYRVLKPGGKFLCMEFAKVKSPLIREFYDAYSMNIIPKIGECITGDRDSYQYFVESIRTFPDQTKFTQMISNAGYHHAKSKDLTFGVVSIYSAYKS
jgi:demethylmenaquinone methyltransferase / 2-methoxy-6-polyprenyl-1,4-benzoquinol methylase